MIRRLLRLVQVSNPILAEAMSGLLGAAWGAWLLLPATTFTVAPVYDLMAKLGPEWLWGLVVLLGGLMQLSGVLFQWLRLRWTAAFCAVMSWGMIAAIMASATPLNTATPIYSILCFSQMWACWRLALDIADRG